MSLCLRRASSSESTTTNTHLPPRHPMEWHVPQHARFAAASLGSHCSTGTVTPHAAPDADRDGVARKATAKKHTRRSTYVRYLRVEGR
jgi:hypothetical protein